MVLESRPSQVGPVPPLILIAPAAFKGTLGPRAVSEALAKGVRRVLPEATVLECPVADGGNGLLDAVLAPGSLRERLDVTGPLGETVSAELGWIDDETAIFESSTACGLALLEPEERDPLRTTTRGVGELIWEAADRGAKTVVVGLGGSATVDGGTGAARGLGWTFQDAAGQALPEGGGALANLDSFGPGWALHARVVGLADVTTPLLGDDGAAPIFGPQKGARPEEIVRLEQGLARLAGLWSQGGRARAPPRPAGGGRRGGGPGSVTSASLCPLSIKRWGSSWRSPSDAASYFSPPRSTAASAPCGTTGRSASSSRRTSRSAGGARWCTSARTSRASTPRS